jgi:sugar/nucleoside kinase (ribokinase family)
MNYLNILGIGNALVDVLVLPEDDRILNELELPKGGMTLVDKDLSSKILQKTAHLNNKLATGGSVANAMNGIAGLDVPSGYIGAIGKDELGFLFKNNMKNNGITTFLKEANLPTGCAISLISPDGERTFATYLGAAVELGSDDIIPEYFKGFDLLLIEGYLVFNQPLIMAAAAAAKSAGLKIALDLASYNVVEANMDILNELVNNFVDIVFANEEEAKSFTGLTPSEAVENLSKRCDIAVVKIGKEGALIQQGSNKIHVPAIGDKVIDTTGAGDYFAAGFLAGLAKGYDLEKSGYLGSLLASKIIRVVGAELSPAEWAEIKEQEEFAKSE